ncbi:hypothetical protein pipiens_004044, partial [Culex pipiens pipiens]
MSSLRKSASFRSRIPVRRSRVSARRCVSPQPSTSTSVTSTGSIYQGGADGGHGGGRPQWYDRRYSSSSSFSSSDESNDSEAPLKLLLKHSADGQRDGRTRQQNQHHRDPLLAASLSVSTDAISLDGLLDCVSSGSFSSPPSPSRGKAGNTARGAFNIYQNQDQTLVDDDDDRTCPNNPLGSSFESLDRLNYALETLKITDTFHAERQAVNQHYENLINEADGDAPDGGLKSDPALEPLAEDADSRKQRKLSDWYYIKTSPKNQPASPCAQRRTIAPSGNPPTPAARRGQVPSTKVLIASKYSGPPEQQHLANSDKFPPSAGLGGVDPVTQDKRFNIVKHGGSTATTVVAVDNGSVPGQQRQQQPCSAVERLQAPPITTSASFEHITPEIISPGHQQQQQHRNRFSPYCQRKQVPQLPQRPPPAPPASGKSTQNIYENVPPTSAIDGSFGGDRFPQPYDVINPDPDRYRCKRAVKRPLPRVPPQAIEYGEEDDDDDHRKSSLTR